MIYVYAGPPASGKSTAAKKTGLPVLEFDAFVTERFRLPLRQAMEKYLAGRDRFFAEYVDAVAEKAEHGDLVVTDTLTKKSEREEFVSRLRKKTGCRIFLYWFDAPVGVLLERNRRRVSALDESVLATMWFLRDVPTEDELFDKVFVRK